LLAAPHPLVAAAAGVWRRQPAGGEALSRWLARLPPAVQAGELTTLAALDEWARRNTFGLIGKFPADVSPEVLLVLATALATKVSWAEPFDVAPASSLGPDSPWAGGVRAGGVRRVLRAPRGNWHTEFIATTSEAGDVAVHTAWAAGGLLVTSVAGLPGVPAAGVLAAAYRLACEIATGGEVARRSLFDLPLGPAPLWEITEQTAQTTAANGREERYTAVLPAWSASSTINLIADPGLGFAAAAAALAALTGADVSRSQAKQSAVAHYSRTGFEAAAVTAMAVAAAMPVRRPGLRRTAELRFGHPYAAVAVATDPEPRSRRSAGGAGPWYGLPVFSAWITEPEEPDGAG
jgi:hypothetical protein